MEGKVNELSPATKKSYIRKAAADIDNRSYAQGVDDVKGQGNDYDGANNKRIGNRLKGIRRATKEGVKHTHAVVDGSGKVAGMASNERDAKDIARRHNGRVVKLKKPMSDKKGDMMINRPFKEGYGGTSFSMKAMSKMKPQEKEKPPFDNPKPMQKDTKDKFGNPIKNRARHLARKAARDLLNKAK
jgi:hypothetical protein